jgi:5-methylcytosine-specific restriction endonuclease McrA
MQATLFDICSVADCWLVVKNKTHQLCDPHYKRLWRHGDPLAGGPMRPLSSAGQKVEDFPDGTRRCNVCDQRLPLESFHKDAGGTLGRRSRCAECHKAKAREWYSDNRERQAGREKDRRAADPERYRRWDMERYGRDREKRIALAILHSHKRRTRLLAGEYDRTVTRANLRRQYGDQCFYCSCAMDFAHYTHATKPGNLASVEHVLPISKGGGHTWDNVVLACLDCNLRKNARTLDEWTAA